jgi:hypothetical protein
MLPPPKHPRKQVKGFEDTSKNDHNQTTGADHLQKTAKSLFSDEQGYRTKEKNADRG